jgi:hypothetical protein
MMMEVCFSLRTYAYHHYRYTSSGINTSSCQRARGESERVERKRHSKRSLKLRRISHRNTSGAILLQPPTAIMLLPAQQSSRATEFGCNDKANNSFLNKLTKKGESEERSLLLPLSCDRAHSIRQACFVFCLLIPVCLLSPCLVSPLQYHSPALPKYAIHTPLTALTCCRSVYYCTS